MRLRPGGRSIAVTEATPAIANRERHSLRRTEQPLWRRRFVDLTVAAELNLEHAAIARVPLHRRDGNRCGLPFEVPGSATAVKIGVGHDNTHRGLAGPEHGARVDRHSDLHDLDEGVEHDLLCRAGVVLDGRCALLVFRGNEARPAATRRRDGIEGVGDEGRGFRVE